MDPLVEIGAVPLLFYAIPDARVRWTRNCRHFKDGKPLDPPVFLAICGGNDSYYLFGCESTGEPQSETLHKTLAEAKRQAELEYEGITKCWEELTDSSPSIIRRPSALRSPHESSLDEVLWAGHAYGLAGYAKMNREISTRLSKSIRVKLVSESAPEISSIPDSEKAKLNSLKETPVSVNATLVRGYTPRCEYSPGRRVCYTMMETQTVHPDFVRRLNYHYDECWTPTSWNRDTFRDSGVRIPISVVPLGVDPEIFKPTPSRRMLEADLLSTPRCGTRELPRGFVFISLYQPTFRKGVHELLAAFETAFGEDPEAALILATTVHSYKSVQEELSKLRVRSRVYGLTGALTDQSLADLLRSSQAYVSASIGEGWNLPLCEAAACGVPVIAGRHSAHSDILDDTNAFLFDPEGYAPVLGSEKVCLWYENQSFARFGKRSIDHLISLLREVKESYSNACSTARRASELIRSRFTWDLSAMRALENIHMKGVTEDA